MKKIQTLLFTLAFCCLTALSFGQTIYYVNANGGSDVNNGESWQTAFATVQRALNATDANPAAGNQIWVAAGTYYPTKGIDRNFNQTIEEREKTFVLQNNLAIYGGFAGTESATFDLSQRNFTTNETILSGDIDKNGILDGGNSYNVIANNGLSNTAVLDGFTVRGGNADGSFTPNEEGGGMYNFDSSPTVNNCNFNNNSAKREGAGMYNDNNSSPTLTNCNFSGNSLNGQGAGMYNINNSSPTLTNCSFSGNSASVGGGGMYNDKGASPTLTNCSFSGNSANNGGGGMYNINNSSPTLTNCIIWNNRSQSSTGTANASVFNFSNSNPTYSSSLIQNVTDGTTNNNLDGISTAGNANYPQFVTPVDPTDAPTAVGDLRLTSCSPVLNQGNNTANNTMTDLAGNPRIFNRANSGIIDLGAYEFQGNPDSEAPTFTAGNNVALNTDNNQCFATLTATNFTTLSPTNVMDNCAGTNVEVTYSFVDRNNNPVSGTLGTTTFMEVEVADGTQVTFTFDDDNSTAVGNTTTNVRTITVTDNQAPTATCADNTSLPEDNGQIYRTLTNADVTALLPSNVSDNCVANPVITFSYTDQNPNGTSATIMGTAPTDLVGDQIYTGTTINFIISDNVTPTANTNTACKVVVTVTDANPPVIANAQNRTATTSADATGDCTFTPGGGQFNATATDNQGTPTVTFTINNGATNVATNRTTLDGFAFMAGVNYTITVTATDGTNPVMDTYTVTITDDEKPTFTAPANRNVDLNDDCQIIIPNLVSEVTDADDNCNASPTITQNPTANSLVSLTNNQTTTVEITVSDGVNETKKNVTLTAKDRIAPTFTAPANRNVDLNANCQITIPNLVSEVTDADDNCNASPTITQNPAANSLVSLTNNQTTTVEITVSDGVNETKKMVTLTAKDATVPTFTAPQNRDLNLNANCQITIPNLVSEVTDADDNCNASPTITQNPTAGSTVSLTNNQTTTVEITVSDGVNETKKNVTLTAKDRIAPTFTAPMNRNVDLNASCQITIPNLVSEVTDADDNCNASPTITQNPTAGSTISLNDNQTTQVTVSVSDGNGNAVDKMVTLTAQDVTRPQLQTTARTITLTADGSYNLTTADLRAVGAGTTDNCTSFNSLSFQATPNTFDCDDVGQQTISLMVTDDANNSSTAANVALNVVAPASQFNLSTLALSIPETDDNTTATISVSRTNTACAASIDFSTQDGFAQAGADYVAQTGTLNFMSGQASQTITLQILGDTEAENNETFRLIFSNPTNNHQLTDNVISITILDDDTRNTVLDFDGVDDQIVVENLHLSQGFTLEMWVNYAGSQTATEALFSHHNNTFFFGFDQGVLRLFGTQLQTQSAFPTNVWKHLVLTINNSGRIGSLYVDGALVASEFPLNPEHQENTARGIFGMGTGLSGANAQLDEVRLWNYMRSFGEIQENMNCELTGTEEGLELYFDFADGIPNGDNTNVTGVADRSGQYGNVPISGFDLVGLESNFLKSDLDLISNCASGLAVDALSLQAKWKDSGAVHLKWQATIRNAATAFTVERSTNGKDFTIMERIAAHAQYQFYDKAAPYGTVYYRIGHQNADGTTTYSNVQQLEISSSTPLVVAPNPTNGQVTVQSSTAILAWELLDTHGRSVRIVKLAEPHSDFDVNISSLPKGIYLLQVQTATNFYYERILLK